MLQVKIQCFEDVIRKVDLSLGEKKVLIEGASPSLKQIIDRWIEAYFQGNLISMPMEVFDWSIVTPFTKRVLEKLCTISFGATASYGEIAASLGLPKGSRAVGGGCGRNPFPLFIPCHRVLRKSSDIGGFSQGIKVKETLLAFERLA